MTQGVQEEDLLVIVIHRRSGGILGEILAATRTTQVGGMSLGGTSRLHLFMQREGMTGGRNQLGKYHFAFRTILSNAETGGRA